MADPAIPVSNPTCAAGQADFRVLVGITSAQTTVVLGPRIRALRSAGFQVTLVSSPGELLDRIAASEGVDSVPIGMRREIAPIADLIALVRIWRLIGRIKPHLVEFGTPKAGLLGLAAAALRGVPCRVYLLRGIRLETARGWKRTVLLAAERVACAFAHVVLCNSTSLRLKALELGLAPKEKLSLLGEGSSIGVDMERYSPGPSKLRSRLGWRDDTPIIGFVGRLTQDKGLPELIESFEQILKVEAEARLLLVGWFDRSEDAVSAELRARIQNHSRIHCTGFVQNTAAYYRAMDVMVLPTWREGFPNVVLEAQASGVPVVATFATGSRDSVIPEVTGLLIPPGYPEAISEAVLKLVRNPERRQKMGKAARAWVMEHYTDGRVLGLTTEFYRSMLVQVNRDRDQPIVGVQAASRISPDRSIGRMRPTEARFSRSRALLESGQGVEVGFALGKIHQKSLR